MQFIRKILDKIHTRIIGARYKKYLKITDQVIEKRIQQRKLDIISSKDLKSNLAYKYRQRYKELPIFFEKEVMFEQDKTGEVEGLYYAINGTCRGVGYTKALALMAIQTDCIIVVTKERDIREFKNAMMNIIYHKVMDHQTPFIKFYNTIQHLFILDDMSKRLNDIKKSLKNDIPAG